ncbi:MAG: 1-(5-phosphoribosyl)-5-[(5-phosphoribosylamino)methylideneamino]imidazole-4-carboxamide isomerase [Clostridiales bacterium]|jgi:phosphoribosylformimino-5-aminoimidazole carboxamide ribotide isomerase|nr:1-(5-phosphoribosyl)-5-[(5-phosphoribosylamino)methylideneamino]imidazole-4-carboxamide isomerase [Clostridiales bacterium]
MRIYPAIDIKDGKAVRLLRGSYDDVTVYGQDPAVTAREWQAQGAGFIHIVDLDGARYGASASDGALRAVLKAVDIPVQVGGGIRTLTDIENKIALGVSRVILGSAAVTDKSVVEEAVGRYGGQIAVGIDAKNGMAAINGWKEISRVPAGALALEMAELGVETIIYTDIDKDGALQGPNIEATQEMCGIPGVRIIASGGVTTYEDLDKLQRTGIEGAIIGRALYTGALDLREVISRYERERR